MEVNDSAGVVLLVEDERQIRRFVAEALSGQGWTVREAETARRGLVEVEAHMPDLIILDLGLPDLDGVDFIRSVRAWSQVPVIVLSARTDESDKIGALDAGADDYLTKPFGVGELLARVRATTRRRVTAAGGPTIVRFGEVEVDQARRAVRRSGEAIHLTPIEFRLLSLLIAHAGNVVTTRALCRDVWGRSHEDSAHYARIYMGHLRRKLEADPTQPRHILTETGVGYRLLLE